MPGDLPEVDLAPGTRVIGDLHLDVEVDGEVEPFLRFLEAIRGAPRLIVLGDLFEYWIGPAQGRTPGGERLQAALAEHVRGGLAVDVVPGNRDFLLDRAFEERTGAHLRPDGLVGRLPGGERVLFVHGDELATEDRAYQRLRRVLRSAPVRGLAPRLPLPIARGIARRLRRASRRAVSRKAPTTSALQEPACRELARRHGAAVLTCGHAHVYRDEALRDGPRWIVVDAFGGRRDTLVVGGGGGLEVVGSRG